MFDSINAYRASNLSDIEINRKEDIDMQENDESVELVF